MHVPSSHQALMRVYATANTATSSSTNSSHNSSHNTVSQHDMDVIRTHFQFLRDDDADVERGATDWQVRMSVRYYRKLFREYALADLSRYQEGKIGLRWRTESEVVAGKGQFICGNKRCETQENLCSYELLFAYVEQGEKKRCLVKVRACESCAQKIFFKKLQQVQRRADKKRRKKKESKSRSSKEKRRRVESEFDSDTRSEDAESDSDDTSEKSIHALCGAINARETTERNTSASSSGFFEDRRGGSDVEAFRDLLL